MLKVLFFYFAITLTYFNLYSKEKWLNIIIHGSVGLKSSISFSTLKALIKDQIENTFYKRNVLSIRNDPHIFLMQPIERLGLHPVIFGSYSTCGAYLYSTLYNLLSDKYFPNQENVFYTYGWSGLISFKERIKESFKLYRAIKSLRNKFKDYKIRIIGYSHGATIAFNLACARRKYREYKFNIDQLIAIGMPVLSLTENFAKDKMFKKIYHIYSKSDWVQSLDIFSPCNFMSYKTFYSYKSPELKNKLKQINISIYSSFSRFLSNKSPSHTELWFFGWAPGSFSKGSLFYPLPFSIFIPYLIYITENYSCNCEILNFDIYPKYNLLKLKGENCYQCKNIKFIPKDQISFMKKYINRFSKDFIFNSLRY